MQECIDQGGKDIGRAAAQIELRLVARRDDFTRVLFIFRNKKKARAKQIGHADLHTA